MERKQSDLKDNKEIASNTTSKRGLRRETGIIEADVLMEMGYAKYEELEVDSKVEDESEKELKKMEKYLKDRDWV